MRFFALGHFIPVLPIDFDNALADGNVVRRHADRFCLLTSFGILVFAACISGNGTTTEAANLLCFAIFLPAIPAFDFHLF